MDAQSLIAFRLEQQLTRERLVPAEIRLEGSADILLCAGGSVRETSSALQRGGFLPEFELAFTVRKTLLPAAPRLGTRLSWRPFGETAWKVVAVSKSSTPASDVIIRIECDNANK